MAERLPGDAFFEDLGSSEPPESAPAYLKARLGEALAAGAASLDAPHTPAPASLKSKIYSALMQAEAAEGALLGLSECKESGRALCVFESLITIAPLGQASESINYCRVCHARVLGERLDPAPIYWHGCPYVMFQNR